MKIWCNSVLSVVTEAKGILCLIFKSNIFPRGCFFGFSLGQLFCFFQADNILSSNWHISLLHLSVRLCASLALTSKLLCLHKLSVYIYDPIICIFCCPIIRRTSYFLIPSCWGYMCVWIHVNWREEVECHLFSIHPLIQWQKLIFYNTQIVQQIYHHIMLSPMWVFAYL